MLCFLRPDGSKRPKAERDKLSASASPSINSGTTQQPFCRFYFVRARMKVETEVSIPKRESHMEVELAKKEFRAWTFLGST